MEGPTASLTHWPRENNYIIITGLCDWSQWTMIHDGKEFLQPPIQNVDVGQVGLRNEMNKRRMPSYIQTQCMRISTWYKVRAALLSSKHLYTLLFTDIFRRHRCTTAEERRRSPQDFYVKEG